MFSAEQKLKMALGSGTGTALTSGEVWAVMETVVAMRSAADGKPYSVEQARSVLKRLEE